MDFRLSEVLAIPTRCVRLNQIHLSVLYIYFHLLKSDGSVVSMNMKALFKSHKPPIRLPSFSERRQTRRQKKVNSHSNFSSCFYLFFLSTFSSARLMQNPRKGDGKPQWEGRTLLSSFISHPLIKNKPKRRHFGKDPSISVADFHQPLHSQGIPLSISTKALRKDLEERHRSTHVKLFNPSLISLK